MVNRAHVEGGGYSKVFIKYVLPSIIYSGVYISWYKIYKIELKIQYAYSGPANIVLVRFSEALLFKTFSGAWVVFCVSSSLQPARSGWRWSGVRPLGAQARVEQAVAPGEQIVMEVREKCRHSFRNAD